MADVARILPDLEGEEALFIGGILKDMSDEQAQSFAFAYRAKRRDPNVVLVLTLVSFGAFGRIYLGEIALGIIYLLTFGFCGIGLLVDLVTNRSITRNYNIDMARKLVLSMSAAEPATELEAAPQTASNAEMQPEARDPQMEVEADQPLTMVQEQSAPAEENVDPQMSVAAEPLTTVLQEQSPLAEVEPAPQSPEAPSITQEPSAPEPVLMSDDLIEELEKLAGLRERGIITEEDFQSLKNRLLGTGQ